MKVERGTAPGKPYFTVLVAPNEVWEGSPHTWIGTIVPTGEKTCTTRAWLYAGLPDSQNATWRRAVRPLLRKAAEDMGLTVTEER